jgi:hypothetical protein
MNYINEWETQDGVCLSEAARVGYPIEALIGKLFIFEDYDKEEERLIDLSEIEEIRLYFAVSQTIAGWFKIKAAKVNKDGSGGIQLRFHSDDWTPLKKPIKNKSFQGFKYADKVPELNEVNQIDK